VALARAVRDANLRPIAEKVERGERLSFDDGVTLMRTPDLLGLGALADFARRRMVGDEVYLSANLNLNPTNICWAARSFCAFGVPENAPNAYWFTVPEVKKKMEWAKAHGVNEVHVVGGLHPKLGLDYYEDFVRACKEVKPDVFVTGFTAVEIDWYAQRDGLTWEQVLTRLVKAGLNAIPGGGAEVLNDRVHGELCSHKTNWREWLAIHRLAHRMGIMTNATLLYGHIETPEERVDHMVKLRKLQDETGGLKCFVPLAYHPANTAFEGKVQPATANDDLRVVAVGRLMLDNVPHVKMLWNYTGLKLMPVGLQFGASDVGGTLLEERIVHAAGETSPTDMQLDTLLQVIRSAGRTPVVTNSGYWGTRWDARKKLPREALREALAVAA
jgi:aminodeoxyfutalosine synthase